MDRYRTFPFLVLCAVVQFFTVSAQAGPVVYRMDTLAMTGTGCTASGRPCVTIQVMYPIVVRAPGAGAGPLNTFIQESLLGKFDPHGVAAVLRAVVGEEEKLFDQEAAHAGARVPRTITRSITVLSDTLGILTLWVTEQRMRGDTASPPLSLMSMVTEQGAKPLMFEDLYSPEDQHLIAGRAERVLRASRHLGPGDDLARAGLVFPEGKFVLTINVGVVHEGLMVYYNAGEIANVSEGPITFTIPWSQLPALKARKDDR